MKVRNLTTIAMLTALTCALSLTFIIPVPQTKGFVTLCEAGIYISALCSDLAPVPSSVE